MRGWSDAYGNLIITPFSSAVEKSVGIHELSPLTTFHVGGTPGSTGAITSDYLNHSATPGAPGASPYLVYSDANGTLKNLPPSSNSSYLLQGDLTWGPGGTGGGNVSSCSGTLTSYIPVFDASSNICKSDLYNTAGFRVGMNTTTPAAAFHTIADGFDASFIAANSTGDYAIFANFDNRVSIGSNTTWNTGGGQGARLWVRGFTNAGSGSPLLGILATDANNRPYFETDDDGKVLVGRFFANNGSGPEGRMAINRGAVDNFVNLFVVTSHNSVTSNLERAFAASNSSYADLLTCWADEHVTMGIGGPPGGTSADARLVVAALNSGRAAHFGGDIFYNGAWQLSDSTLKKNIQPINDALSVVKSLVPKSFEFDSNNNPGMNLTSGHHYGFMAQEVERILPSLVQDHSSPGRYDTTGAAIIPSQDFKAMNYTEIIPFLTGAIQEQQSIIDSMKVRMDAIEARLLNCCPVQSQRIASPENNSIDIVLSSANAIILNQNDPNPFSEQTRITYNIPESVKKADIIFYTNSGVVLKTVTISERGIGQMNVYASDLSSDVYIYSLVADGKTIDTKKMVVNK